MKLFRSTLFSLSLALGTVALAPMVGGCGLIHQGVVKNDKLVDLDETCNQAWADYESNLQRRSDLIPQLVAVVKGSAAHEQDTLTAVMQARASATRPEIHLDAKNDDFSDPAKVAAFQQAQSQLGSAIGKLMMVQEKYPDLQANSQFHDLMVTMEGTENRLLRAREQYNKAVGAYNMEFRHVDGVVFNAVTGHPFKLREFFKADQAAFQAPTVDFSKH